MSSACLRIEQESHTAASSASCQTINNNNDDKKEKKPVSMFPQILPLRFGFPRFRLGKTNRLAAANGRVDKQCMRPGGGDTRNVDLISSSTGPAACRDQIRTGTLSVMC